MRIVSGGSPRAHKAAGRPGRLALLLLALLLLAGACGKGEVGRERELGQQVYATQCASCHGLQGEGAPNWRVPLPDGRLLPPPHDSTGHTWHHGDGLLFRYVKGGGTSLNIPGFVSGMPAFGEKLSDQEIRAVLQYLKTFWGPDEREFQARVSERDPLP